MILNVINKSTVVPSPAASVMVRACAAAMVQFCTDWGLLAWGVQLADAEQPGTFPIYLLDDADQANALGYHTTDLAKVFARPVLDAGNALLFGSSYTVASVLDHELKETRADFATNVWVDLPQGGQVAQESADPVEGSFYADNGAGQSVTLSDYVLPSWFNAEGKAPFSHTGAAPGPFQLAKGGYMIRRSEDGSISEVFGEEIPPAWRLDAIARDGSRRSRRLSARR